MMRRITQHWSRLVTPAWVAPLCAGLAFSMGLLALVLDARAWYWSSAGLVAITLLGKLELRDRAAAIVFAFDYGLVQPAPS